MADKNESGQQEEDRNVSIDNIDLCSVALLRSSVAPVSSRCSYDRNRRASNLDLSNTPGLRPGSATRDSGYNTDVSPAATISPATNSSRQQHFVFDNISHSQVPELEDRLLAASHIPPHTFGGSIAASSLAATSQPSFRLHFEERSRSTPPLRLSPDIFRISASPRRAPRPSVHASSRTVSESSDTNRGHYDFDSENDEDGQDNNTRSNIIFANQKSGAPQQASHNFDSSEGFLGLQLPVPNQESDDDDDDDDDVFYRSDILENWGVASEPQTPKNRTGVSLRRRRYCSADDENDSLLGACGGYEPNNNAHSFSPGQTQDQLRHSFFAGDQERQDDELQYLEKTTSGCRREGNHGALDSFTAPHSEQSFSSSQGFQPSCRETPVSRNSSENVSRCDRYDTDSDNDSKVSQFRSNRPMSEEVAQERSLHHPVTRSRCRRINVTACLRLSSGSLLPRSSTANRVSVSTQTPHMTSIMVQQILDTPVAVPNEARGTAANRLRRQSDGAILQPRGSRPLPDIVPPERDRSMSVPDVQTMIRMQRAREVGRELRRLSDDFHFGILLPSAHQEAGGLFSRITVLRDSFTNIVTFLRHPFSRPRQTRPPVSRSQSTSVDFVSNISSISEHPEDVPGD